MRMAFFLLMCSLALLSCADLSLTKAALGAPEGGEYRAMELNPAVVWVLGWGGWLAVAVLKFGGLGFSFGIFWYLFEDRGREWFVVVTLLVLNVVYVGVVAQGVFVYGRVTGIF
jgi:hypothetical protein